MAGAERAFAMKGVEETPVEEILRFANVSRPTFYKFFDDKDEVLSILIEKHSHSLLQAVRGAVAGTNNPYKKLERGLDAYLQWRVATGGFARVMDAEAARAGSPAYGLRRATHSAFRSLIEGELQKAGRVDVDPLIHVGVLAAIEAVGARLLRSDWDIPGEMVRARKVILRILQASLAEEKDPVPPLPRLKKDDSPYPKKPRRSA